MSFSISSALDSGYSTQGSSTSASSSDSRAGRLAAKLESLGISGEDAASATVTLSKAALDAAEGAGKGLFGTLESVAEGVADVIAMPFDLVKAAAGAVVDGVETVAKDGWDLVADGAKAVVSGVESAVHEVAVDIPRAVASEVGDLAKTAMDDLSSVVGGGVQIAAATGAGGVKLLSALL